MWARDYRDIIGGGVVILLGVFTIIYSLTELRLGTASRMGPGFFPAALGVILTILGAGILGPAVFRTGTKPNVDIRSLVIISVAVFAFAFLVRPFGLVPAIIILVLVASRADNTLTAIGIAAVAAVLSLGATLIFRIGLGLQIAPFNWPW